MSRQQETSKLLAEFKANPLVKEWIETLTSESAKELYSQFLYTYFNHSVKVRGFTIKAWVEEVGNQRTSMNAKDRRAWATELSSFLNTYISPVTSKPYAGKTRKTINTAIKSFLVFHAGDLEGKVGKQPADQSYADAKRKEELTPISIDEFKKLVFQATNTRDRAMLLSLAVGLGTGEWVEFADESWKYTEAIRAKTVPLRVNIVRPKKPEEAYFVLMWDDAIDSLNLLLEKRERDLGHPLKKGDYLFVNKAGGRVIEHRVQRTVRELAEASGVEARELGRIIYRIRPAEIGRDFFRTLCEQAEVPTTIAEFSLGHKIDKLEYNKFYRTDEGKARVERYLRKVRPLVNVVSGRGTEEEAKGSYFEEASRLLALMKSKTLEEIQEALVHEVFQKFPQLYTEKTQQLTREHKLSGELKMADLEAQPKLAYPVFHHFTRNELFPIVLSVAQKLTTTPKKPQQKVIEVEAVQKHIDEGWSFRSSINGHFALMEKDG